jgi:hypothetical protein
MRRRLRCLPWRRRPGGASISRRPGSHPRPAHGRLEPGHLYGDDGNLIGEQIGWVERYDGGKQWKGFTRHGALPFRCSRPAGARDVLRKRRSRSQQ